MAKINVFDYGYGEQPPEPSPKLARWVERIRNGWKPNRRIKTMGYYESAEWYGIYIWEYLNVIYPMLEGQPPCERH